MPPTGGLEREKMNRTQRAYKRKCKAAMQDLKRRKKLAICEMKDSSPFHGSYHDSYNDEVRKLSHEEKGLRKWHRESCKEYYAGQNSKEASRA